MAFALPYGQLSAFLSILRHRSLRPKRFVGSAEDIARAILEKLWNGRFLQTSLGHFSYFWLRDVGTVAESLLRHGYRDKVRDTMAWALARYQRAGNITTCILRNGHVFDAPRYASDSVPWMMHILRVLNDRELLNQYRNFLQLEVARYARTVLDDHGLVRSGTDFAEIRDAVLYRTSTYSTAMLVRDCAALGIASSLPSPTAAAAQLQAHWNGKYFNADAHTSAFSAEANLFPFWLDVVNDAEQLQSVIQTIEAKHLDSPFALRYTDEAHAFRVRLRNRLITPNYQGTTLWPWLGMIYLQLLQRTKSATVLETRERFATMIESYGTFPEVLNPDGSWYRTLLYCGDHGMIWCALYLDIAD